MTSALLALGACSPHVSVSASLPSPSTAETGNWRLVDAFAQDVQEAARFAVQAQAVTTRSRLIYKDVLSAQTQVVAGLNFQLQLLVMADDRAKTAVVTVQRNLQNEYKLMDWRWLDL